MAEQTDEQIRQDYLESLQELTFNSRPIITNLTVIAQENIHTAQVIAKAIEEHIQKCPPGYKLPALYLLDSICKNVGPPYNTYFGTNLFKTFTDAFTSVQENVRQKLGQLFDTWKEVSPITGTTLFPSSQMSKIENFLTRARASFEEQQRRKYQQQQQELQIRQMHQMQQHQQQQYQNLQAFSHSNSSLSQSALFVEVDRLIDLTSQRKAYDPSDVDAEKQLAILSQLRKVISTQSLPSEMLPSIQRQLVTFSQKESERSKQRMGSMGIVQGTGPANYQQYPSQYGDNGFGYDYRGPPTGPAGPPPRGPGQNFPTGPAFASGPNAGPISDSNGRPLGIPTGPRAQQPSYGSNQYPSVPPKIPTPTPAPAALPASLISSLTSAGLLNINNPASRSSSVEPSSRSGTPLTEIVDLNSISLQKPRPHLVDKLYKDIPNQCSNCGKRFRNDQQHLKSVHLDWHFRVNKRLLEENRSQSRCWYLTAEQWIEYKDEEEILGISHENDDDGDNGSSGKSKTEKAELDLEALRNRKVIAPSNKKLASLPCPICQEKFNSVWDDDEEEWVWKNAMRVQNRIFHATCYAESERSGGDLIQRILGGTPGSSRPTPPPASTPAPIDLASIIASVKRKAEESDTDSDIKGAEPRVKREKV